MYRPWMGRKFGFEIELDSRYTSTGRNLRDAVTRGLRNSSGGQHAISPRDIGYYHSDGRTWDVKTDSSCGWEIATPALTLDEQGNNADLTSVCRELRVSGATATDRCGLHVHFDCSDLQWFQVQQFIRLWVRYEPFLFSAVAPGRRHNHYCGKLWWNGEEARPRALTSGMASVITASNEGRFEAAGHVGGRGALNYAIWFTRQRIEVRLHQGTVNDIKMTRWAMLISALIARAKASQEALPDVADILPAIPATLPTANPRLLSTKYVGLVMGLLPSTKFPFTPLESHQLVEWWNRRRMVLNPDLRGRLSRPESAEATVDAHADMEESEQPVTPPSTTTPARRTVRQQPLRATPIATPTEEPVVTACQAVPGLFVVDLPTPSASAHTREQFRLAQCGAEVESYGFCSRHLVNARNGTRFSS